MLRFHKKRKYTKHTLRPWTKHTLLQKIVDECSGAGVAVRLEGNTVVLHDNAYHLAVGFGSSNYADDDKVELIATIYIKRSEDELYWEDLFSICQRVYGKKYRALDIYRDEEWESSRMRKECIEVYAPLFKRLQDPSGLKLLGSGSAIELAGRDITLRPINLEPFTESM